MIKERLKNVFDHLSQKFPNSVGALQAIRARRFQTKFEEKSGLIELSRKLKDKIGKRVVSGPFEGLKIPDQCFKTYLGPVLLGTYEKEIQGDIKKAININHKNVINIGSKLGYYAVGFALNKNETDVYAFDIDTWARKIVRKNVNINECENVYVRWACTPKKLRDFSGEKNMIISDCEGYEHLLFKEVGGLELEKSDLIIEVHPAGSERHLQNIKSQFSESHIVEVRGFGENEKRINREADSELMRKAAKEYRDSDQKWVICWSRYHENTDR